MAMVVFGNSVRAHDVSVLLFHPGWVQTDMGGSGADITLAESANGLIRTIDASGMAETSHGLANQQRSTDRGFQQAQAMTGVDDGARCTRAAPRVKLHRLGNGHEEAQIDQVILHNVG